MQTWNTNSGPGNKPSSVPSPGPNVQTQKPFIATQPAYAQNQPGLIQRPLPFVDFKSMDKETAVKLINSRYLENQYINYYNYIRELDVVGCIAMPFALSDVIPSSMDIRNNGNKPLPLKSHINYGEYKRSKNDNSEGNGPTVDDGWGDETSANNNKPKPADGWDEDASVPFKPSGSNYRGNNNNYRGGNRGGDRGFGRGRGSDRGFGRGGGGYGGKRQNETPIDDGWGDDSTSAEKKSKVDDGWGDEAESTVKQSNSRDPRSVTPTINANASAKKNDDDDW